MDLPRDLLFRILKTSLSYKINPCQSFSSKLERDFRNIINVFSFFLFFLEADYVIAKQCKNIIDVHLCALKLM
jgi:hypothetical protein